MEIMRKIKFRAKDNNNQWQYGFVAKGATNTVILPLNPDGSVAIGINYNVKPETVCQYTGLDDIYRKEVYEGDIVVLDGTPENRRIVVYYEEAFNIATFEEYDYLCKGSHPYLNDYAHMTCLNEWSNTGCVRVIGNIYDDPDLIKQQYSK